ncbi:flagellar hook-basal body protein [Clostridium aminobutyricum]|uniref:Flagellar hook-basal body protein n=1 Tax=Clostridium aminobutyricum TaxID=33953 RepID=A0A939DAF8_CLOAM|nr:flagellar hook-basal body protein [Clostridium aminobutyricum]MBN7773723.1 flagellar hook-basal body protein [Clostridium aminobutyricum]
MDISFYTAGVGAKAQQAKLDVIANNMANANTTGYKSQSAGFEDLLYSNIRDAEAADSQLKVGSGVRVEKTDINFSSGGMMPTDGEYDYAIVGDDGFFAVQNPATNEIYYTRSGAFQQSVAKDGKGYLVNSVGDFVLDENLKKIELNGQEFKPGVFDFNVKDGMLLAGDNLYSPTQKNGQAILQKDAVLSTGYLEASNVEVSDEMVKLIESQRSYSLALKMVQTSNEVEETINNLR